MLIVLFLTGCGGGGGGDGGGGGGEGPGRADDHAAMPVLSRANDGLTGFIWTERDAGVLDLDSGKTTVVGDNNGARPRADGQEFVTVTEGVRFVENPSCGGNMTHLDRVTVYDTRSGLAVAGFDLAESLRGVPRLAPDGLTLAGHWNGAACFDSNSALTVWDRDGQKLVRGLPSIEAFDWLPDGRLVFEIDGDIGVETERNTLRFDRIVELGNVPGRPGAFDVSPDGATLVFEMVTDRSGFLESVDYREATVWRVNIDGTGLERIVDSSRPAEETIRNVNAPMISPGGDALMVTENWISGGNIALYVIDGPEFPIITGVDYAPIENGAVTQLVPFVSLPTALPPPSWTADGIRPVFERDDEGFLELARLWPLEGRSWTSAVAPAATVIGSLPATNGRPNRSLPGSLYRHISDDEQTAIERLDLATGRVVQVVVPPGVNLADLSHFAISDDASRFAVVTNELFDNTLHVFDRDGQLIASFKLETETYHLSPEGAPRFARGSNSSLAWVFDDDDFGQGAVVLDINAKRFEVIEGQRYTDALDWFSNGDLLLVDGAELLRASRTTTGFALPVPLASVHSRISDARVHPDGRQIVYSDGRQIVLLDLSDGAERRLTAWTDTPEVVPEFSPDGRFVAFRKLGQYGFGWPWIVATDAEHINLGAAADTPGAMRVGEGSELDWRITRSEVLWRGS